MNPRLGNTGYLAMKKQTAAGTVGTPNFYVQLYEESVETAANHVLATPAAGHRFATSLVLPGQRSHKGDVTILGEANALSHIVNAFMTKGTTTGSNPYTHPYTLGEAAPYTWDIALGNNVKRIWDVQVSKITPVYNGNEMQIKASVSALGSFHGREISTVTGSGPYTITLKDPDGMYDGSPTKGLVVGDLIRFYDVSAGTSIDATVASIVNGTQITTSTNPTAIASGDVLHLRQATPSYDNQAPFTWSKTKFFIADTAANALAGSQVQLEQGTNYELTHAFRSDDGEQRSGSHDPAALARTIADLSLTIKRICDTPEDVANFNALTKRAIVIRHYAGSTNQYEFRVTINHYKVDKPLGLLKAGEIIFAEQTGLAQYDTTDGQAFDLKVISSVASATL